MPSDSAQATRAGAAAGALPAPPAPGEPGGAPAQASIAAQQDVGKEGKVNWYKVEEEEMLNVFEEVRAAGAAPENGFKAKTYKDAEERIEPVTPAGTKHKDHKMVENHWKIMKANWREVRDILAQSGFGWNVEEDCVEAEPSVWDSYVEKNSKAKKWRKKSLWYYMRVNELCAEASANGEFALDPALGPQDDQDGEDGDWDEIDEVEHDKKGKKRAATSSLSSTSRPAKRRSGGSEQFGRMVDILSSMAEVEAGVGSSRDAEEDPIAVATNALLDSDSFSFTANEVAALISHFAANAGAARAYATLARREGEAAEEIRSAYLFQIIAMLKKVA